MNSQFKLGTGFSTISKNEMNIISASISTMKIDEINIVRLVLFRHNDMFLTQLRIYVYALFRISS